MWLNCMCYGDDSTPDLTMTSANINNMNYPTRMPVEQQLRQVTHEVNLSFDSHVDEKRRTDRGSSVGPSYQENPGSYSDIGQKHFTTDDANSMSSITKYHTHFSAIQFSRRGTVAAHTHVAMEIQKPQLKFRAAQVVLLIALILCIYFANDEVSNLAEDFKNSARSINIGVILLLYFIISIIRASFPPWFFCFPLDAATQIIIGDRYNVYVAALIWQGISFALYIAQFKMLREFYTEFMGVLVGDSNNITGWYKYFFDVRQGIRLFDKNYTSMFHERDPVLDPCRKEWAWNGTVVVLFFNCEYYSNYICILWLATRANDFIDLFQYVCSLFVAVILEYPKTIIWIRIYTGVIEALRLNSIGELFQEINLAELIAYIIIAGCATIYIHGKHFYMMFSLLKSITSQVTGSRSQTEPASRTNGTDASMSAIEIVDGTNVSVSRSDMQRTISFGVVQNIDMNIPDPVDNEGSSPAGDAELILSKSWDGS